MEGRKQVCPHLRTFIILHESKKETLHHDDDATSTFDLVTKKNKELFYHVLF